MLTPHGEIPDRLAVGMTMAEQHDWLSVRANRRAVLRGLVVAGASMSPLLWKQSARAAAGVTLAGRLLVPGGDPSREMTLGIAVPGTFRQARFEASSDAGGAAADMQVQMVRGSSMRYARGTLTGLRPATGYAYQVRLDDSVASTGTFRTAPDGAVDLRFTAFGDQGVGDPSRSVLGRIAALKPDLHLVAGDICYANQEGDGGPGDFRPALWDAWLAQNNAVAGSLPFLCTLGNHEMEPGFADHGYAGVLARVPLPGTSPLRCPGSWAVRYGTVGFVGLDSNDVSYELARNRGYTGGAQRAWLDSTLAAFRRPDSGVEFVVAVLHHSPYSTNEAHASEGGIREAWVPLFDQHQVDLVIAGHNHCYERTLPLRGGRVTGTDPDSLDSETGTTYVTAGGGGANSAPTFIREGSTRVSVQGGPEVETIDWSLPGRTGTHTVLVADVHPGGVPGQTSTMTLRAVDAQGRVLDTVELRRPSTVHAPVVAADGRRTSSGEVVLVGAAAAATVAGGVAAAVALRSRREQHRPDPEEPGEQGPSRVVVRPLLAPGIDSQTVVLRPPGPPGPAAPAGDRPGGLRAAEPDGTPPGRRSRGWDELAEVNRAADRAARPLPPSRPVPAHDEPQPTAGGPPAQAGPPQPSRSAVPRTGPPVVRPLTERPPPPVTDRTGIDSPTTMIARPPAGSRRPAWPGSGTDPVEQAAALRPARPGFGADPADLAAALRSARLGSNTNRADGGDAGERPPTRPQPAVPETPAADQTPGRVPTGDGAPGPQPTPDPDLADPTARSKRPAVRPKSAGRQEQPGATVEQPAEEP